MTPEKPLSDQTVNPWSGDLAGPSRRSVLAGGLAAAGLTAAAVVGGARAQAAAPSAGHPTARRVELTAPEGGVRVEFSLDRAGRPLWAVFVHDRNVLAPSPLGFVLDDGTDFTAGLQLVGTGRPRRLVEHYELRQGKVSDVHTRATERTVTLRTRAGKLLEIAFWASVQGAAVRYRTDSGNTTRTVTREATGLTVRVPSDGGAQFAQPYTKGSPKYQEFYLQRDDHRVAKLGEPVRSQLDATDGAALPLLLRTCDQHGRTWWLLASESGTDGNYPACHLGQPVPEHAKDTVTYPIAFPTDDEALGTFGPGAPQVADTWQSPWRFVAVAASPAELAQTTLATDLAAPNTVGKASWVTPGGASFSWLTDHDSPTEFEAVLPFFDLAQEMGWPYSLLDAKWDQMTDSAGKHVPLERLVAEASNRDIRLFLWYNSAGTNNNAVANTPRDLIADPVVRRREFQRLSELGVAGLKVDGWQSDKQQLIALQRDLLEDAARYQLHIVLHNTTIPRGWDRTYPHLLGYEGGIASEYYANAKPYTDQIPEQTTIAAIVRNAVGPFDFGTTLFRPGLVAGCDRYTTDAHELALTVVYQSGFNGYADGPQQYLTQDDAVRTALRAVPLAWDETRYLHAEPTRDVIVARRKGRTWWVAGVNGVTTTISPGLDITAPGYARATGEPLRLTADLSALGVSRRAHVTLFSDTSATNPTLVHHNLRGNDLAVHTAPFGGFLAVVTDR